jgi:CubicO group peptidase (beta-lactamase class C family)
MLRRPIPDAGVGRESARPGTVSRSTTSWMLAQSGPVQQSWHTPCMDLSAELADWPVGSAAAAVIGPAGVLDIAGDARPYPWASGTKVITALAVLDGTFEGVVGLDDQVGPPGSTLRHVLAHASGLAIDSDQILARPGTRRVYSNRGIDLAAQHLEERTGRPFTEELTERVLDLLGMNGTILDGSPAHGASGPIADLAALAADLLAPTLLLPNVVSLASTVAFPGLGGVLPGFGRQENNDWGLGLEIRDHKNPHWTSPGNSPATFGHFGQSGSFIWVDPVARLACVSLADTPFGPWAAELWPRLSTAVLDAYAG